MKTNKDCTIILGPIQGVTDCVYRSVYAKHFSGVGSAVTPFVPASGAKRQKSKLNDLAPERNKALPIVPQILAHDADPVNDLIHQFLERGYSEINWNLGCPHPMMTKKKRGSGLLPYPDRIKNFLDRVCAIDGVTLSIKTRVGFDDPEDILALIDMFNAYPLQSVTIHPRIAAQLYDGDTYDDIFDECCVRLKHPVVYNGSIDSLATWTDRMKRFPDVKHWMIGRGILTNPFLPEWIIRGEKTGTPADHITRLRAFHDDLCVAYEERLSGPAHQLQKVKGLWPYLAYLFENGRKVDIKFRRIKDLGHYKAVARNFFASSPKLVK